MSNFFSNMASCSKRNRIAFNNKLIRAVEARKLIWDVTLPDHKNTHVITNLWQEIGKELNISVHTATDRWRNLRDTFRKINKKVDSEEKNEPEELSSIRWPHYHQMKFLIPSATPSITGNITEENPVEESENSSTALFEIDKNDESPSVPGVSDVDSFKPSFQSSPKKRRRSKLKCCDSGFENFLTNQKQLLQQTEHHLFDVDQQINNATQMDSFEMFLLSLAPNLRGTPPDLLPQLQMNLVFVASKYRNGEIPVSLINLQEIQAPD